MSEQEISALLARVKEEEPARRALIDAHEALFRHLPVAGRCSACDKPMPCPGVTEQIAVMRDLGHIDAWEALQVECGAHTCRAWTHPYRC